MATGAALTIALRAKTATFDKAMRRASKRIRGFGSTVANVGKKLAKFGAASIAVGAAISAVFIRQQLKVIDATAKFADRVGISTEALVGLRHAANIMGVESASLDKSLDILNRRMGELSLGSGEALNGMKLLKITTADLINLKPDEQFGFIADKINELATQSEKAAAAYFLFGRAGSQLINLLELGSKGIRELTEEAEKLGLTFTRLDAAKVEEANDSLQRLKSLFTGAFRRAAIELAPLIDVAAKAFIKWGTEGEGVGAKVVKILETVGKAIAFVGDLFVRGISIILKLAIVAVESVLFMGSLLNKLSAEESLAIAITMGKLQVAKNQIDKFIKDKPGGEAGGVIGFFNDLKKKAEEAAVATRKAFELRAAEREIKQRKDLAIEGLKEIRDAADNLTVAVFAGLIANVQKAKKDAKDALKGFAKGVLDSIKTPLQKLGEFADKLKDAVKAGLLTAEQAALAIAGKRPAELAPAAIGTFQEIDTSRINVSGLQSQRNPELDEAKETNEILNGVLDALQKQLERLGVA